MSSSLSYKGFFGSVNFSTDDRVFFGKTEAINDLVTYEGTTADQLEVAFKCMVEKHIQDCDCQENLCETPC